MKAVLSPRKSPRQARSQAMVELILDAAARVLIERGYAGANTNLVAERAGISVGSLYQYFPNKDSLISALHSRHMRQMNATLERAFEVTREMGFEEALATVVDSLVEAHRVEAGLHRVLEMQLAGLGLLAENAEFERQLGERIHGLFLRYQGEIRVTDLRLANYMLLHAMHALVHAVVHERPSGVSLKQATQEMTRLARAYLQASG